jgi:hypothetical protein
VGWDITKYMELWMPTWGRLLGRVVTNDMDLLTTDCTNGVWAMKTNSPTDREREKIKEIW